ncbi:hypothetical protein AAHA92_06958 [Salvia divinorum]|uniref:HNH endonuclease n=1 Tax=Salvia divinorum TaxID=28513 RepID=A0ABD1I845_SALDI
MRNNGFDGSPGSNGDNSELLRGRSIEEIDCDDDQWSQIVQKDGNARYMRNKSWPHWEAWKEIYGKDRDYYVNPEEFFDDEVMLDHVMPATADGSMLNEDWVRVRSKYQASRGV